MRKARTSAARCRGAHHGAAAFCGWQVPNKEGKPMTTPELLDLMRLLSALESWAMSKKEQMPDYLHDSISRNVERVERYILDRTEKITLDGSPELKCLKIFKA